MLLDEREKKKKEQEHWCSCKPAIQFCCSCLHFRLLLATMILQDVGVGFCL